ncbi:MAG: nickel-binding protein [Acidobacteriaceae bacterium]
MQKFIIERTVPGIGDYSPEKLTDIIAKTRTALQPTAGRVQWQESFVTNDKIFSIYIASDEAALREFCKQSPLPTDSIHQVRSVVDLSSK